MATRACEQTTGTEQRNLPTTPLDVVRRHFHSNDYEADAWQRDHVDELSGPGRSGEAGGEEARGEPDSAAEALRDPSIRGNAYRSLLY
jgi:hypothetical protein